MLRWTLTTRAAGIVGVLGLMAALAPRVAGEEAAPAVVQQVFQKLKEKNPDYPGKSPWQVADGKPVMLDLSGQRVTDLSPLAGLSLRQLSCAANGIADLGPLAGMPLEQLDCHGNNRIRDLSPLAKCPLRRLDVSANDVSDLAPLAALPLTELDCSFNNVRDFSPLKGRALSALRTAGNLAPLDLAAVAGMPLVTITFDLATPPQDQRGLGAIPSLREINGRPTAPPAEEQKPLPRPRWQALIAKNVHDQASPPSFGLEGELMVWFAGEDCGLSDLAFLRAQPLRRLLIANNQVNDLAPLAGMPLTELDLRHNAVNNLTPLTGLPLTTLLLAANAEVSDLSPLARMPLTELSVTHGKVQDLTPLAGLPLRVLDLSHNAIADLGPLARMPLEYLILDDNQVTDLRPLAGMKLRLLACGNNRITSLAPLVGMPLVELSAPGNEIADLTPLAGTKLTSIVLNNNHVRDLKPLAGLTGLRRLELENNQISDLTPLTGCCLTDLHLRGNPVTDLTPLASAEIGHLTFDRFSVQRGAGVLNDLAFLIRLNGQPASQALSHPADRLTEERTQLTRLREAVRRVNPQYTGGGSVSGTHTPGGGRRATLERCGITDLSFVAGLGITELWVPGNGITDLSPLRGLPLRVLNCGGNPLTNLAPLAGLPLEDLTIDRIALPAPNVLGQLPLRKLSCNQCGLTDLGWLRLTRLESLACADNGLRDLAPLAGLPLTRLFCARNAISDLAPLKGLKLQELDLTGNQVRDLAPLAGMPLTTLKLYGNPVTEASVLAGLPLQTLELDFGPELKGFEALANRSPLRSINGMYRQEQSWTFSRDWLLQQRVHALLRARNPDYRWSTVEVKDGVVTRLALESTVVTDLTPLAGLPIQALSFNPTLVTAGIEELRRNETIKTINSASAAEFWARWEAGEKDRRLHRALRAKNPEYRGNGRVEWGPDGPRALWLTQAGLRDLTPLRELGLPINALDISDNQITDLAPLAGTKLTGLQCNRNQLTDLTPLKGLPLRSLSCSGNQIADLAPLAGMPLTALDCSGNRIRDLTPLRGLPLESLQCGNAPPRGRAVTPAAPGQNAIADVSALAGMPLRHLDLGGNPVADLSPLAALPLETLVLVPEAVKQGLDGLRLITSLREINGEPVEAFWWRHDGDQQVTRIQTELKARNPAYTGQGRFQLTEQRLVADLTNCGLRDLGPLAGLRLNRLSIAHNQITDLAPLAKMPLQWLNCRGNQITTLAPLFPPDAAPDPQNRRRPRDVLEPVLWWLDCSANALEQLDPLAGSTVQLLNCANNRIQDLAPLQECMNLTQLDCQNNQVTDLSPLANLQLRVLNVSHNRIAEPVKLSGNLQHLDLSGNPLREFGELLPTREGRGFGHHDYYEPPVALLLLDCRQTAISDLTPLAGLQIYHLLFDPDKITRGWDVLPQMPGLALINGKPVAEFQPPRADTKEKLP